MKRELQAMNYHNTDVTACDNDYCTMKLSCMRWWLGTNKDPYQVYCQFPLENDRDVCSGYINYWPFSSIKKD